MQRKHDELGTERVARRLHRARDFVGAGHEDQRIALRMLAHEPLQFSNRQVPDRRIAGRFGEIFGGHRISAPLRRQHRTRLEIFLHRSDIQSCRHDDDKKIGPRRFLDLQRAGQRDVAVEMPFVKFVEDDRADAVQVRISQHLAQQHAFGDITDPRGGGDDIVEPHLVADLAAEFHVSTLRDPRRKHTRWQPARLQDHHLAIAQQTAVEQHLRHLGRFARAGRRSENQTLLRG